MRGCFQKFSFNCRLCFQFESFNELVRILTHVQRAFQIFKISQLEKYFSEKETFCKNLLDLGQNGFMDLCVIQSSLKGFSYVWDVPKPGSEFTRDIEAVN